MASSTHRKLLLFPNSTDIPNPTVQTCLIFCNTQKNDTVSTAPPGFCPPACLDICPSTCHHSLFSLLPPDNSLPHPNNPHNLSPLLISMLILLATGFLSITFYLIYTKFYSRFSNTTQTRRNNNNNNNNTRTRGRSDFLDEEHGPNTMVFHPIWYIPTVGLNPTVINSIKVCTYENEKGAMEEIIRVKDCAVCLGEFVKGDELRVLPKCNHAFHIHCIDTWLKSHVTCPLCRAPIIIIIIPPDHHDHAQQTTGEGEVSTMVDAAAAGSEDGGDHENNVVEGCLEEDGDKEGRLLGSSSSQKWSFQRGDASLVGRSLSCSGKIFSSRFNDNQPSPDS